MAEKHTPNFEQPMVGQGADRTKIKCKDCVFRDRATYEGEPIGITKAWCQVYEKGKAYKPTAVILDNADCKYYMKDGED